MAQQLVEKKGWKNHDLQRTIRLASYGFLVIVYLTACMSYIYYEGTGVVHLVPSS